jgi:hypothetical protein
MRAWFGVTALPTMIFNEKVALVGAVPEKYCRLLLDWLMAGEPGGVIPLQLSAFQTGIAGHSTAGRLKPSS